LERDATPVRRPGLVDVPVDGETIVVHEESARLHHLDSVASSVWRQLDGSRTVGEVTASLAEAFDAPPAQIEADVRDLIGRLVENGLLELR
jgi:pyrroloquinoline quinone biosynthesis protein D